MMAAMRLPLLSLALATILPSAASADFVTLTPTSVLTRTVGATGGTTFSPTFFTIGDIGNRTDTALAVFDLSAIPAGAMIQAVSLDVTIIGTTIFQNQTLRINVGGSVSPTNAATPAQFTAATPFTSTLSLSAAPPLPARFTFDARSIVATSYASTRFVAFTFSATNGNAGLSNPELFVQFAPAAVPEPSSIVLVSLASVVLCGWGLSARFKGQSSCQHRPSRSTRPPSP